MTKLVQDESIVTQWFANHHFPLSKLRALTLRELGRPLELIKAAATRFGTHTLVGERLKQLKPALQATVCAADYVAKNYKDTGNTIEDGGTGRRSYSNKGATCKKLIQDDRGFWAQVDNHLVATMPIFKFLRRMDTGAPTVGKCYSSWFELGEYLRSLSSSFKSVALKSWELRWAYGHRDVASAAYVVDPEFHGHDQAANSEVTQGYIATLEKIGILMEVRRREGASQELAAKWKLRCKFINEDPKNWKTYENYPDYPSSTTPSVKAYCKKVSEQLVMYRQRKGLFAHDWVFEAAETMPASAWWETYGATTPELQSFALLLLSQPSSASICERINSEFAFVKDPRRNRLKHYKANKLVALFHNLRLMFRMKKPQCTEPLVGWNEEDKHTGLIKYGVTHFEPATVKKIDCPVRQPVIFLDHDKPECDEVAELDAELDFNSPWQQAAE